jgi:hypothetical protein
MMILYASPRIKKDPLRGAVAPQAKMRYLKTVFDSDSGKFHGNTIELAPINVFEKDLRAAHLFFSQIGFKVSTHQ